MVQIILQFLLIFSFVNQLLLVGQSLDLPPLVAAVLPDIMV